MLYIIYTCVCVYIYIYTHICTYIYTHIYKMNTENKLMSNFSIKLSNIILFLSRATPP